MVGEQALANGHVLAASSALIVGAAVLFVPKGTHAHRVAGAVYVVALVLVDVAALALHREATFGGFHILAVASLITLGFGLTAMLLGRRSAPVMAMHAYCMTWSYAGLVAAGCGQGLVAAGQDGPWVALGIAAVLAISGVAIFSRVPGTLEELLAER